LSYAPNNIETYYQLALQCAIQRNLERSISSLSQALHLDKSHIPSIHLLTLVLTSLKDYEKALQTCHTLKFDGIDNLDVEDAEALMEMQLSYLRIVEVISGRELALEVQKGVFKLYNRLFGPVLSSTEHVKRSLDIEQRAAMTNQALRRTKSNINSKNTNHMAEKGSIESGLSLQVPADRIGRQRSLLRRRPRSRSVGAHSVENPSRTSIEYSEKLSVSSNSQRRYVITVGQERPETPVNNPQGATISPSKASVNDKSLNIVQRLPNPASELPSKYLLSSSERRNHVAKVYRAKLWLACAAIYRRGRQWDGAQAAIQDALLCDVCHEEVFTEVLLISHHFNT
jgi:tetratricopeptide (TPR) repeat protein